MSEFAKTEQSLEKKLGPLPVWAWGGLLAGAAYIFYSRRIASTAAAQAAAGVNSGDGTVAPTDTTSNDGFDPNTAVNDWLSQNPQSSAYPAGLTAQGTPAPTTNAQWARLAADFLTAHGDVPALVQTALAKYTAGSALTQAEQAVVDQALTAFGSPPEGVLAVNPGTPPPTTGGTTPTPKPNPQPNPTGPKFPNQTHRVGTVGQSVNLRNYVNQIYPNATTAEKNQIVFATVAKYPELGSNIIPGGKEVTFVSQFVK